MSQQQQAEDGILIRSPNWLGDAVMCLPAIRRIKEAFPELKTAVLVPEKIRGLFEIVADVDEVIPIEANGSLLETVRRIRRLNSYKGVLMTRSFRTALEFFLAGVKVRIGYAAEGRFWLLTHPVPLPPDLRPPKKLRVKKSSELNGNAVSERRHIRPSRRHHVELYLNLAGFLGARSQMVLPQWRLSPLQIVETIHELGLPDPSKDPCPWIVVHPGAHYSVTKRWIPESFVEVARRVHSVHRCRWLIIGSADEIALARWLTTKLGQVLALKPSQPGVVTTHQHVWHLAGKTDLKQLAVVLKLATVFLGNDSGPMHLAAALGTPVIALFGSTDPSWTGPQIWSSQRHVVVRGEAPCSPCFLQDCVFKLECMRSISPERVSDLLLAKLAERADRGHTT